MKPAFAGTRDTVAIPFGCRVVVVSTLPREHRRVVNGSFGDRFVKGIYLHADSQMPTIRMFVSQFDLASKTELSVKDFKSYPDEFPFRERDASCLTRSPDTLRKELAKMHAGDEADDQLIEDALQSHVITRSQSQAVERAKQNAFVTSVTPQPAAAKRPSKKGAKAVLVSKPLSAAKDYLDITMSEIQELSLAHAFVTHKFQVTL
jgi:hypothetical protein